MTDSGESNGLARQIGDLREEGEDLHALLATLAATDWQRPTTFKGWTVWDVVAHLHFSDHMGVTTIAGSDAFKALMKDMRDSALSLTAYTRRWLGDLSGPELHARWRGLFLELCERLAAADPEVRLTWPGPGMKPRMFATARQMETWAHAWEIYDLLGTPRTHGDRIRNIVEIGVRTFGWSFSNRGLDVPDDPPYLALTAPSGSLWTYNEPTADSRITGSAVAFCQVVTQVRNVADTELEVSGATARRWMAIAQCFAGPPEEPPPAGTRAPNMAH
ncbi:MAG: TIGR03084 family metal-binding protein [Pseudomonadales bacterium]